MWGSTLFYVLTFAHSVHPLTSSNNDTVANLDSKIYGKPSRSTGKKVMGWKESSQVNPEELGEYLEGDILIPTQPGKNGLTAETSRWPEGVVPYEIAGRFSEREIGTLKNAIEQYHRYTCITFRKRRPEDVDWIAITNTLTGCWSVVGRVGGRQEMNLQAPNCFAKIGTVLHEFMHVIGFQHEQNRWERDSYVTINWKNIQKGRDANFIKASKENVTGFGIPYDYGSVLHYSSMAFSSNGQPSITVIKNPKPKIGQREGFSKNDVEKIIRMYNCAEPKENFTETEENATDNAEYATENLIDGFLSFLFP